MNVYELIANLFVFCFPYGYWLDDVAGYNGPKANINPLAESPIGITLAGRFSFTLATCIRSSDNTSKYIFTDKVIVGQP